MRMRASTFPFLFPTLLLIAVALVYLPGLAGGFIFDDFPNIVTNARLHAERLDWASVARAIGAYESGIYGRPLATVWFAADFAIGGKDPTAFKVSSLVVHLLNTALVYALLARLLAIPSLRVASPRLFALAVTAAWALHPLQVSTVLYVVQRMETLATLFILLGLIAYVHGRLAQSDGRPGGRWLVISALLAALGMLAKESAVLFVGFALCLELCVFRFAPTPGAGRTLRNGFILLGVAGALVFFAYIVPTYSSPGSYANRDFTMIERLLTQARVLPMYLGQIVLPLPNSMTFYYDDLPVSTGLLSPATTLAGLALIVSLLALAWWLRGRAPLVALGILWFFAAHALTSNVLNLEMVFEHRNYVALLGVVLALGDGVRRLPMRDGPALKIAAVVGVLVLVGALTAIRSATWGEPFLLASDLVSKNPDSPRAASDLATIYFGMSGGDPDSPFFDWGQREFRRAAALPNASPLPDQSLIIMATVAGKTPTDADWDALLHKVRTRPPGPQELAAVTGLMKQRDLGDGIDPKRLAEVYRALLDRGIWPSSMYANYAEFVLIRLGDRDTAREFYRLALVHDPDPRNLGARMAASLVTQGHRDVAEEILAAAAQVAAQR